ncbi:hypothetical protein [Nannocystis radixulma]|uniref:Uncharacterized protein n=1 Tax=Nannocystis radixulma TaxID=2995305 RepID=A0ABT5AZD3_9BACT|nr:hypothetical protein [Nannocystis radixulma]MDC0667189.1 hypothetical protein [Nannocystis radixulma]
MGLLWSLACSAEPETQLPPIVAASKYVDYSTTADTSVICMDDLLAREDRFIEVVASTLGVEPPSGRIRHVRVTGAEFDVPESWPCPSSMHCYWYDEERDLGTILSVGIVNFHELVHAVDIPALGDGHRTLGEGLATYLGSETQSDPVVTDFPERFLAMLAESPEPSDYRVAMHFVGSLMDRWGAEKFRRLRRDMPADATPDEFASLFTSIYGMTLDAALSQMTTPVWGKLIRLGCGDGIEQIPWAGDKSTEADLRGECGDPGFVGGGFVGDHMGFGKTFTIDLPEAGYYQIVVTAPDGALPSLSLEGCPDVGAASIASVSEGRWEGVLHAGRHAVSVGFPQGPEPRGEAHLVMEWIGPLGSP